MSVRPIGGVPLRVEASDEMGMSGDQLREQLAALQSANAPIEAPVGAVGTDASGGATLTLDDLNETERSAAHIGASPDAFRPIPWMNTHHYTSLLKNNNLDGRLAQMIEVRDAEHIPHPLPLNPVLFVHRLTRPSARPEKTARAERRGRR